MLKQKNIFFIIFLFLFISSALLLFTEKTQASFFDLFKGEKSVQQNKESSFSNSSSSIYAIKNGNLINGYLYVLPASANLKVGESIELQAFYQPPRSSSKDLVAATWMSSNSNIATVDYKKSFLFSKNKTATIFGVSSGNAEIKVTYKNISVNVPVLVARRQHLLNVEISGFGQVESLDNTININCDKLKDGKYNGNCSAKIDEGETVVLKATPSDGYQEFAIWSKSCNLWIELETNLKQDTCVIKMDSDNTVSVKFVLEDGEGKSERSIFGIGYVVPQPGYAEIYSKAGVKWVKFPDLRWQYVEPSVPKNGRHIYQWDLLDKIITEYQSYGFNITPLLRAKSDWASKPIANRRQNEAGGGIATTPPKDQYWNDYSDWVNAVVERYDGDGKKDMPGLKFPILYYEIESEVQHDGAWQGTEEEYLKLLEISYQSAKKANDKTKIILAGINFGDIFDDMPDQKTIDSRVLSLQRKGRNDFNFIKTILQKGKYDVVEFHYNRDWKGIYGTIDFIKKYTSKPIWAGDATSAPWLIASGEFNPLYDDETGKALYDKIVSNEKNTVNWYRAEQAKLTTKKFVVSADMGLKKVIIETTNQWPVPKNAAYFWLPWHIQNMIDEKMRPLPVYYTLKLLTDKLDGYSSVVNLNFKNDAYGYKFIVDDKPVLVLWYDKEVRLGRGAPKSGMKIDLSKILGKSTAKVTYIITDSNRTGPETQTQNIEEFLLTDTPVFVE